MRDPQVDEGCPKCAAVRACYARFPPVNGDDCVSSGRTIMPFDYRTDLAAERLRRVYEVAPPRVLRYLAAEIAHVRAVLCPAHRVLDLGAGYGRAALALAGAARSIVAVDHAGASLALGRALAAAAPLGSRVRFAAMDCGRLAFPAATFDVVICVQNGLSAFGLEPEALLREAARVARRGACLLFSTYAERFFPERLEWFEAQAAAGLLAPIDRARTGGGVIACADGFRSRSFTARELEKFAAAAGLEGRTCEVDGSSLFLEVVAGGGP